MSDWQTDDDPYAAPSASILDRRQVQSVEPAPRLLRLGAWLVNLVGAVVSVIPGLVVFDSLGVPYLAEDDGIYRFEQLGYFLLALGPWALWNVYEIHTSSQSVGKRLFGIKVVRFDGSRASTSRQLFARFFVGQGLLGAVPLLRLVDALCIFRSSHQTLHDGIADTIVVRVPQRREWDQRSQ
tara:strand:- start:5695 stop:6240 length:546 start_codon:yes stop_codon:yes gene_type:complete